MFFLNIVDLGLLCGSICLTISINSVKKILPFIEAVGSPSWRRCENALGVLRSMDLMS